MAQQQTHDHLRVSQKTEASRAREPFDPMVICTADFESFSYRNPRRMIYLDTAASAHKPFAVTHAMLRLFTTDYASVHRGSYVTAVEMTRHYEKARADIASFMRASIDSVVFTSGTTASINLVAQTYGRHLLRDKQAILVTRMEHHANIVPWQVLAQERGLPLRVINVLPDGTLDLDHLDKELAKKDVGLLAVTHVSNVLGTINPIADITARAHRHGAVVVVDGTQAAPHLVLDVTGWDVDFYAMSAHKMYGPTGVGVLYAKPEHLERMPPFLTGGDMVETVSFQKPTTYKQGTARFEAGTPPFIQAIGMGAAARYLTFHGITRIAEHEHRLLKTLMEGLEDVPGAIVYGPKNLDQRAPVVTLNIQGCHPTDVAAVLEEAEKICVRVGHHCAMPLIESLGVTSTLRISIGLYNQMSEIERTLAALRRASAILAPQG